MASFPKFLRVGLAALACAAALAACAPPLSDLGDEPPGATLILMHSSFTLRNVFIDGAFQGTLTGVDAQPACDKTSLVEEVTAGHITKFVTPGTHTFSSNGGGSGTVTTSLGVCTYQTVN